jgi:cytochrome P450
MLDDPRPFYARARKEEPVFFSEAFSVWVVTRHDDVAAVARDPVRFSSAGAISMNPALPPEVLAELAKGYPIEPSLVDSDPPVHTRHRSLAAKALSARRVAMQEPQIRARANELVDRFQGEGRADLVERFAFPLPFYFIMDLLGLPHDDTARILGWIEDQQHLMSGQGSPEELLAHARGYVAFQRYLADAIEDRKKSPRDDILSDLAAGSTVAESPVTVAELIQMLMQFIFAGHETTTALIAHAMWHLLQLSDLYAALCADLGLAPAVIEEALRVSTPISGMYRTATEDVELGGVKVPKGAHLNIVYFSANHDEARFPEPERFDIRRGTPHLAFGNGPHFCIGAQLARMEGRVALEVLTQRLKGLRLVPDQPLSFLVGPTSRRLRSLLVAWDAP